MKVSQLSRYEEEEFGTNFFGLMPIVAEQSMTTGFSLQAFLRKFISHQTPWTMSVLSVQYL